MASVWPMSDWSLQVEKKERKSFLHLPPSCDSLEPCYVSTSWKDCFQTEGLVLQLELNWDSQGKRSQSWSSQPRQGRCQVWGRGVRGDGCCRKRQHAAGESRQVTCVVSRCSAQSGLSLSKTHRSLNSVDFDFWTTHPHLRLLATYLKHSLLCDAIQLWLASILSVCVHVLSGDNGLGSLGQSTAPHQPGREDRAAQQGLAAGGREVAKPAVTWQKILGVGKEVEKVLCHLLYNECNPDQSNFYDMSPMNAKNLSWELHGFPLGGAIWSPERTNLNLKCLNNFEWNATKVRLLRFWRTNDKVFKWKHSTESESGLSCDLKEASPPLQEASHQPVLFCRTTAGMGQRQQFVML